MGEGRTYAEVFRPGEDLAEDEIRATCCGSGNPIVRRGQAATSWLVEIGNGDKLIFDVGGGSVQNLWSLGPPEYLDKLFLTHLHLDHVGDFHVLYDAMVWGRERPLRVFGPSGYTSEMGTAAFVDHMVKAARWHDESKVGIGPSGGMRTEVHEIDVAPLGPDNPQALVYDENGVRITAFPVIHCIYGAVGYRLEWNGLSLSFHGDGTPSRFEAEQAAGVDLFMHEGFIDPGTFAEKAGLPLRVAESIDAEHTTAEQFGELCQIVQPRAAVAYHYFVGDDTIDPFFERLRTTWDGPTALAQDLTVVNLAPDQITFRQAETDPLHWPPPAPADKATPVMEERSKAAVPDWLEQTKITPATQQRQPARLGFGSHRAHLVAGGRSRRIEPVAYRPGMVGRLRRRDLDSDPLVQLEHWLAAARAAEVPEPEAMTLATVGADGRPSARMVLLRGLGPDGVDLFTNRESRKAQELDGAGHAALVLYWEQMGRQIRVEGPVSRLDAVASDAYFQSRPRGSRIAAWASPQSRPIADRAVLDRVVAEAEARFPNEVPRPPFWGGYRVTPELIEFWQAGEFRLHDRFRYRRAPDGWIIDRLGP